VDSFSRLLQKLVGTYGGTKQDLATAIGVTPSRFSHLLSRSAEPTVDMCLKLASVTGASATDVLRAAGKGETAALIEELFGKATRTVEPLLTPKEIRHMSYWRLLYEKERTSYTLLIETTIAGRYVGRPVKLIEVATEPVKKVVNGQ
jgi:transcriptional regulator with XRE-family HTH domain